MTSNASWDRSHGHTGGVTQGEGAWSEGVGDPTPLRPDNQPLPQTRHPPPSDQTPAPTHTRVNVRGYASYWNAYLLKIIKEIALYFVAPPYLDNMMIDNELPMIPKMQMAGTM